MYRKGHRAQGNYMRSSKSHHRSGDRCFQAPASRLDHRIPPEQAARFSRESTALPRRGPGSKQAPGIILVLRRVLLPRRPQREQGLPHPQQVHQLLPVAASC